MRSGNARAYVPALPRASDACSRIDEVRDKLARCYGERLLLAELLRVSLKDLSEPRARRDALRWFESGTGRFSFPDVARYLGLDAESLRRAAGRRICFRNGPNES